MGPDPVPVVLRLEYGFGHFGGVARSIRPIVGDGADDVAQDAFAVAWVRWDEVQALDVPVAWVRKVAVRMAVRRASRDRHRDLLERRCAATPLPDTGGQLGSALGTLPPRHSTALWLHHVEGYAVSDVAAHLGSSVSATK